MALDQEDIDALPPDDKEMGFLDHLEELRWHIIRAFSVVILLTIVAFLLKDVIYGVLIMGPAKPDFLTYRLLCKVGKLWNIDGLCISALNFTLQSRQMTGQFMMHITSSFVAGLVTAFPYVIWEIWRFIKPGLYIHERKATTGVVFYVTFLFIIGILFGYYVISPLSINFLANYQLDPSILNQFDITSYVSTLIMMVLASGLMFQLPMAVWILTKIGILTPTFMRTYRRHAIIVILLVAAFITPSPDVFSQMLVAVPLYMLYEVSIFISALEYKRAQKRATEV